MHRACSMQLKVPGSSLKIVCVTCHITTTADVITVSISIELRFSDSDSNFQLELGTSSISENSNIVIIFSHYHHRYLYLYAHNSQQLLTIAFDSSCSLTRFDMSDIRSEPTRVTQSDRIDGNDFLNHVRNWDDAKYSTGSTTDDDLGKISSPLRKPESYYHRQRSVSWGQNKEIEHAAGSHGLKEVSMRRLVVADLENFEDEAETNLLRAMELKKTQDASSHILSQVPNETAHSFEVARSDDENEEDDARPLLPHRNMMRHRRGMSVEQSLFDLTHAMEAIHADKDEETRDTSHGLPAPEDRLQQKESTSEESSDIETGPLSNSESSEDPGKQKRNLFRFHPDWELWENDFPVRKLLGFAKKILLYCVVPLLSIAFVLYYLAGNPPNRAEQASASYILLFITRQFVVLGVATMLQRLIISLALNRHVFIHFAGPVVTLLIVQSKGWPQILFWWSIFDMAILSGPNPFANHWLYFQDFLTIFTDTNPSGNIVDNKWYSDLLRSAVFLSIVVSVKRFLVGLYLSRQTYQFYGQKLALVMRKMLLISEVARLAKSKSKQIRSSSLKKLNLFDDDTEVESVGTEEANNVIDMNKRDALTGSLHYSEKLKLMQLLEQWEEPTRYDQQQNDASISAVLRFRKALTFMQKRYPFSREFGPADNREACIESAQKVYSRLISSKEEGQPLKFETIALLAVEQEDASIDTLKAKELIKLFRPDREGNLSMVDFVRSVDAVYKEFRLLQATIDNASQIDRAFEQIFNVIFYIVVAIVILSQLGFDPMALFLSLSSIILAFAFMIGNASSKYFEGLLFVLVRRPYGIGDLVEVGSPESSGSLWGALPWRVENVTLFDTTVVFLPTNERASLSNGSLANSRIINWARSPQAQFHIFLQFPLDTPYEKIVLFKNAIEEYMKARPREWRALNGFRANQVMARDNFIEYLIVIQ